MNETGLTIIKTVFLWALLWLTCGISSGGLLVLGLVKTESSEGIQDLCWLSILLWPIWTVIGIAAWILGVIGEARSRKVMEVLDRMVTWIEGGG
jgi:hypothetical protein